MNFKGTEYTLSAMTKEELQDLTDEIYAAHPMPHIFCECKGECNCRASADEAENANYEALKTVYKAIAALKKSRAS